MHSMIFCLCCGEVNPDGVLFAAASQLAAARFETTGKHATISHNPTLLYNQRHMVVYWS